MRLFDQHCYRRASAWTVSCLLFVAVCQAPAVFGLSGRREPPSRPNQAVTQWQPSAAKRLFSIKRWHQQLEGLPLRLHAFQADDEASLALTSEPAQWVWERLRQGQVSFVDALQDVLQQRLPNAELQLRPGDAPSPVLPLHDGKTSRQAGFRFAFGGVELCDYEVKGHYREGERPVVFGQLPVVRASAKPQTIEAWPTLTASKALLDRKLGEEFRRGALPQDHGLDAVSGEEGKVAALQTPQLSDTGFLVVEKARRCYHIANSTPLPAWELKVKDQQGLSYRVIVDGHDVYQLAGLFFDLDEPVTAQVQAYDSNPLEGQLQVFSTQVTGQGTLASELFATVPDANPSVVVERAYAEDHQFIYEPSDERFAEASAYIHTVQMYQYFQTLGYSWHGNKPLNIRLHVVLSNTKNNALYEPDRNGRPAISIGDGDGIGLRNLALDADVVSHEFGHHVVYRTLKSTVGESLVLHEGLADFFAYTKTGDTCLGESICPADSNFCVVKNQCLRTANNVLTYDSASYNAVGAHLKGQLVSGMLWDLRGRMDPNYVTKLVYRALDYLISNSGLSDFVIALMLADKDFSNADNACTIFAEAENRGLAKVLAGIDCTKQETWIRSDDNSEMPHSTPETKAEPAKKKDKGLFGCGFLALGSGPPDRDNKRNGLPWILLIVLALPLLACARPYWGARRLGRLPSTLLVVLFLLSVFYCPPLLASGDQGDKLVSGQGLLLALSVVWEGESLSPVNLDALSAFRAQHPDLRLIQFLNPAYLTKKGVTPAEVAEQIKRVLHPEDTAGMHLHAWKNFVEDSGVNFRKSPSFWGQVQAPHHCADDCGHDVPLSIYTELEIEAMLNHGRQLIKTVQLPEPQAFMAGGWMGAPHVLEALARTPIRYDFSPVAVSLVKSELQYYPLYNWLQHQWPGLHPFSQPSFYYTNRGELTQVVANGASVDYRSAEDIVHWYKEAASLWQKDSHKQLVLHLSLYQESAFRFLPRLARVLASIASYNAEHQIPMRYLKTLSEIPVSTSVESHTSAVSLGPLQWERGL